MGAKRMRRNFTDEFKEQMVRLYLNGKPRCEIIREYELSSSALSNWIIQHKNSGSFKEGDVNIGLNAAIKNLANKLDVESISYDEMLATSSAAGGLKMSVHGLVYDMTVKAAREAALGAGAIIHNATAGKLRRADLKRIKTMNANIILLAGGVDHGERETALYNAEKIAELGISIPIIYAGNVDNQEEIKEIFEEAGLRLYLVENVYPKIDQLNIEPTREVIQNVFEEHIIHAPGMSKVRELVGGPIIPTHGAVMEASKLLKEDIGDLITFDVGGATTDLHSVTEGSEEINRILISPEPVAKRTVEGDLGVYVNMENIVGRIGADVIESNLQIGINELKRNHQPIPKTKKQIEFVEMLTKEAVEAAIERHVGEIRHIYGPNGKATVAEGKDLSNVKYIVGTGGALTKLDKGEEILKSLTNNNAKNKLKPTNETKVVIDKDYIMASLGVLSKSHPKSALKLLKSSCNIE